MKNKKKTSRKKIITRKNVPENQFRRARTKIKKPKFLSLSKSTKLQRVVEVELDPETQHDPPELSMADHMFAETEGPTTLTGLLNGPTTTSSPTTTNTAKSGISYVGGGGYEAAAAEDDGVAARSLVRTAMRRRREGDEGVEEKWVSISEVVERRCFPAAAAEEEVSSGGGGLWLKLDYEEVLNAWSGKGGPFCEGVEEEPQTVPDLDQYSLVYGSPFWDVRNNGHWSVPENSFNVSNDGNYSSQTASIREASVLRYREKRRNRLFAKRIRYEVRKLNAEKRPRIKGRFVTRGGD